MEKEKIDIENLKVGLVTVRERDKITSGYDGTKESLKIIAEKINEIIDWSKKFENLDGE